MERVFHAHVHPLAVTDAVIGDARAHLLAATGVAKGHAQTNVIGRLSTGASLHPLHALVIRKGATELKQSVHIVLIICFFFFRHKICTFLIKKNLYQNTYYRFFFLFKEGMVSCQKHANFL